MGWANEMFWRELARRGIYPNIPIRREEDRCRDCGERETCPAYDTGVIYPCPHYRREEDGKKE